MKHFFVVQGGELINRFVLAILKVPEKEVAELFNQAISALVVGHID